MSYQKKMDRVLSNLENIKQVKIEDSEAYNEFYVTVIYQNGSDIIICDNSEEVNIVYRYITQKLNEFNKSKSLKI